MIERKLLRPQTLEDALVERQRYGRDALPIAGGQSLLVLLRNKLIDPTMLLDLEGIQDLRGFDQVIGGATLGAMTAIHSAASHPELREIVPVLSQAASKVG